MAIPCQPLCGLNLSDAIFRIFEGAAVAGSGVLALLLGLPLVEFSRSLGRFRIHGSGSRGAIQAVNHTSKVIPWLRLFECHRAPVTGVLNDDFLDEELVQDTLGLVVFPQAAASS